LSGRKQGNLYCTKILLNTATIGEVNMTPIDSFFTQNFTVRETQDLCAITVLAKLQTAKPTPISSKLACSAGVISEQNTER